MTDQAAAPAASSPPADGRAREYLQTWAQSLSQVLGQIAGKPVVVDCRFEPPAAASPGGDSDVRFLVKAAGGLRGEMTLRLPRAVALPMAQLFLGEPQDAAAEFKPDHQESLEELLRQVAGYAATALKPAWGEVQLRTESNPLPAWPAAMTGWLVAGGDVCRVEGECQLSAELQAALEAAAPVAVPDPAADATAVQAADASGSPAQLPENSPQNLGLLMGVQLDVMLRFGERSMALREILDLGAGSVVELDRKVEDPVDLLLDGRLVARGEVVIVDGNYGLRVLEVMPA